jgi:dTMP kinase
MTRGRFVTFEGIDGAGKSTHLAWANAWLREQGIDTVLTREPGGTALGEKLRELLLKPEQPLHPETETLLVFAARREHIHQVIRPALERGNWVLCDRFTDATFAYQGGGHGVDAGKLRTLEAWTHGDLQPDLTLLFDVSVETGKARTSRIKAPDRFEREDVGYFAKVREAYLERMRQSGGRMVRIDGSRAIEEVQKEVGALLQKLWKR